MRPPPPLVSPVETREIVPHRTITKPRAHPYSHLFNAGNIEKVGTGMGTRLLFNSTFVSGIPFDVSRSEEVIVVDVKFLCMRVPSP